MASLKDCKKSELQQLAQELGVEIEPNDIKRIIIKKIVEDPDYDEELTLAEIKIITQENERIAQEKEREREREREERDKEREKEEREREREREERDKEREREEREKERAHELEKTRILQQNETLSIASTRTDKPVLVSLKNVMHNFDPSKSEISLFLNLFQRQANKLQLDESQWTTQLLSLLPSDIAEMVLREDEDKIDDFEHVKAVLLKRFKSSPEAFRKKFISSQKASDKLWKDLGFELKNYLEGWINGLEIKDFESLKNLLVADQLKKRATQEMRDHFIDSWGEITDPQALADKLDHFELARRPSKKTYQYNQTMDPRTDKYKPEEEGTKPFETRANWRDKSDRERTRNFEEREPPRCFICKEIGHLKINCPLKNKEKTGRISFINSGDEFDDSYNPYLSSMIINGRKMPVLRDTGSNIDLISRDFIKDEDFNGETIGVKSPLQNEMHYLPLADIKIKTAHGVIITQAAVLKPNMQMRHYLLGNETNKMLEKVKKSPKLINALIAQNYPKRNPKREALCSNKTGQEQNKLPDNRAEENSPIQQGIKTGDQIQEESFREEQKNDLKPKPCLEKAREGNKKSDLAKIDVNNFREENSKDSEEKVVVSEGCNPKIESIMENGQRTPALTKVETIKEFPKPKNKTGIRKFLGLTDMYGKYIENYATIITPLTNALKRRNRNKKINWDAEMEEAFTCVKRKLAEHPILHAPDYEREFFIKISASSKGGGVVLSQKYEDEDHPILHISRKFTGRELNYEKPERECAAIIFAIKKLRYYLEGQKFTIEADHNPLVWLKKNAENNPRLQRWILTLQPFNYEIRHKPGTSIPHVDCLSRM